MGGKALKCKTKRVKRAVYDEISADAIAIISKYFEKFEVPKFVDSKDDFGNVDIIVCSQRDKSLDRASLIDAIAMEFNSVEKVVQGSTIFFEYRQFVVEVIEEPNEKSFLAKLSDKNWGILTSLVSVLANSMGLCYSVSKLYVDLYEEPNRLEPISNMRSALSHPLPKPIFYHQEYLRKSDGKIAKLEEFGTILLTDDQSEIYKFLGFHNDTVAANLQFSNETEIFEFVMNCDNFERRVYTAAAKANKNGHLKPFVDYFNDAVNKDRKYVGEKVQYPKMPEHRLKEIYTSVPQYTTVWDKKAFHRWSALEHFNKVAEYKRAVRAEWLKKVAEMLAPTAKSVEDMDAQLKPNSRDWLKNFAAAKSQSYCDGHPDLIRFPELSVYDKWVLEQGTTAAIEVIMKIEREKEKAKEHVSLHIV